MDGGNTWTVHYTQPFYYIYSIGFIDSLTGFATSTEFLKTTDGGVTWTENNIGQPIADFQFINESVGFAFGGGDILKTINSGKTWKKIGEYNYNLYSINFAGPSDDIGFGVGQWFQGDWGTGGTLFKTVDGGKNWEEIRLSSGRLSDVYFPNSSVGYAVGFNILKYDAN